MRGKMCALSGHRTLPESFDKNALYDRLEQLIKEGYDYFFCGMAEGFDLTALECLIDLKGRYRVGIEACIPFRGQEKRFSAENRKKYVEYLEWCDYKVYICDAFSKGAYLARNRYMVDCSDSLLAYCREEKGGTFYTVEYAKKIGKEIFFI